jgi:hypothetical protein
MAVPSYTSDECSGDFRIVALALRRALAQCRLTNQLPLVPPAMIMTRPKPPLLAERAPDVRLRRTFLLAGLRA